MRLTDMSSNLTGWPRAPVSPRRGRSAIDKHRDLRGVLWKLDNSAKCMDLPREFRAKSAVNKYITLQVDKLLGDPMESP